MIEHNHLLVMSEIDAPFTTPVQAEAWMDHLISDLGMTALIPPKAVYCETVGNRGLTGICAINTSHIVVHLWDEGQPSMQLDVYTCGALDLEIVWSAIYILKPKNPRYKFYDRKSGFRLVAESGDAGGYIDK